MKSVCCQYMQNTLWSADLSHKKKNTYKVQFSIKIFFKIYSSEYKQIVQIAIKTLRPSSGIKNSIYFPLCVYLSKINFIAFTSN